MSDVRDLLREVVCVPEGLRHGVADGRGYLDELAGFVIHDAQLERVEDLTLELGWRLAQGLREVGEAFKVGE